MYSPCSLVPAAPAPGAAWQTGFSPVAALARAQSIHHHARQQWLHHRAERTGHKRCAKRLRQAARALLVDAAAAYHASPRAAAERALRERYAARYGTPLY